MQKPKQTKIDFLKNNKKNQSDLKKYKDACMLILMVLSTGVVWHSQW